MNYTSSELKYCECCGALWVRPAQADSTATFDSDPLSESQQTLCGTCRVLLPTDPHGWAARILRGSRAPLERKPRFAFTLASAGSATATAPATNDGDLAAAEIYATASVYDREQIAIAWNSKGGLA